MIYKTKIDVELPRAVLKKLYDSIKPEFKDNRFNRSQIRIMFQEKKALLSFLITAEDATALSATANAVIKLLTVHEKILGLVKNDR